VWVQTDGARVKEGDIVFKLNADELEKKASQLTADVADGEEKVRAAQADGEKRVTNARSALTKSEEALALAQSQNQAALEKAQAEVAFREKELNVAKGQLDKRQRLAEERLLPRPELEAAEDEVRAGEFALAKAQRAVTQVTADNAAAERLRQLDIEKAKLELAAAEADLQKSVAQTQRDLETKRTNLAEAQAQLEQTQVKSPTAGLFLTERNWRGDPLRVGDEVEEGRRMGTIIDPAKMWVRCDISEADIERVKVGQKATVLVPALRAAALHGVVKAIDNLARERGWWEGGVPGKKVFAALIELTDREERLRPGMGATIQIQLEHVSQGLMVPVEALFEVDGRPVVYCATGDRYRAVAVVVGKRNESVAVIQGKIGAGDRVACKRPAAVELVGAEKAR
jgi:multidrug resistance efflux pump